MIREGPRPSLRDRRSRPRPRREALSLLAGSIKQQALIIAFRDTFWATALLVVASLPLVHLLGKPKKGAKVAAGHWRIEYRGRSRGAPG